MTNWSSKFVRKGLDGNKRKTLFLYFRVPFTSIPNANVRNINAKKKESIFSSV